MKIKKLKINAFGSLKEKEIELDKHINIIHGNNESGKSTLLKFISNIFYGTSKNKKGKEFSDYDRYKPWNGEEFSGKLTYELDNGAQYEVFRDFNKKNPTVYNEQLEDISKQFTIDKTYGNQFFVEQTNVDETMFYSCLVSMQQEVKLDKSVQNAMVQKVANLAGTGDDSISYKKALEKINKKQIEEIGSTRSQGRPINIIKEEKFKLQDEIGELEEFRERKSQIKQEKEEKQAELEQIEKTLEIIKQIKIIKEQEKLEQEKININEALRISQEEKMQELQKQKEELIKVQENSKASKQQEKPKNKKIISIGLLIVTSIIEITNMILLKNTIVMILFLLPILFSLIWTVVEVKKEKRINEQRKETKQKEKQKKEELQKALEKIEAERTILQNNIEEGKKEIEAKKQKIELEQARQKEKLQEQMKEKEQIDYLFSTNQIQQELDNMQEAKNRKKLEYHSLELEENTMTPKLEKMALIEEKLEDLKVREAKLEKENKAIELTKEMLEIAYQKMKQNITPKLTEELSNNIQKIANGKYTQISMHEEKGMVIEKENGEYIEAEKLSVRNH